MSAHPVVEVPTQSASKPRTAGDFEGRFAPTSIAGREVAA
jgi:hypothetical protein